MVLFQIAVPKILHDGVVVIIMSIMQNVTFIAGSLESAYSLNWGALQFLGKGGGETLALL